MRLNIFKKKPKDDVYRIDCFTPERMARIPYVCSRCYLSGGPVTVVPIQNSKELVGEFQYQYLCDSCYFDYHIKPKKYYECCGWRGDQEMCGVKF